MNQVFFLAIEVVILSVFCFVFICADCKKDENIFKTDEELEAIEK